MQKEVSQEKIPLPMFIENPGGLDELKYPNFHFWIAATLTFSLSILLIYPFLRYNSVL